MSAGVPSVAVAPPAAQAQAERWLRLLTVAAIVLPTVVFAGTAALGLRQAFRAAEEAVTRSALLAREHAQKVLLGNEVVLERVKDMLGDQPDARIEADGARYVQALERIMLATPEVRAIAVFDADGRMLLRTGAQPAPRMDASDRSYFAVQRAADAGLYVSPPMRARAAPQEVRVVVSKRRTRADGSFGGVYALSLRPDVFSEFYRDLARGDAGASVSLFRADGELITREPPLRVASLTAPASGAMMSRVLAGEREGLLTIESPVDGKRRLTAFRQVDGHTLYVSATRSHEAIYAGWARQTTLLAAFTFPTALLLAWVSWLALQHTRRERAALERWQQEIAKRSQVEEALRQTQRLEALGHLTGGVAHDVNNLLMVVSNNAHLLKRLPPGRDLTRPLDAILRAVANGARLTRQLLAFSRRQALRPETVDLRQQLPVLLDLVRHSVSSMVQVDGEVAAGTRCIHVDPSELELAMINLAVNARDAMSGSGRLQVRVHDDGASVRIAVSDTGSGIAAEHLGRVFEPFFTTKAHGKGTGLGLSQVYGFCQQAGGEVLIASTPGEGTTVTLVLPAVDGSPLPGADVPRVPHVDASVLLVEDNAEVADATVPLLESWGYRVTQATSGDEALRVLAAQRFDLLLSDIVMPGATDGLALARWAREHARGMGIVLTTGHADQTAHAQAEGIAVLQKPWMPQALAEALSAARR